MRGTRLLGLNAAVLFCPALAAHTLAQTVAADTGAVQLEEIIVTAQKRAEPLQRVPISMSVLTGDALKASGIDNAGALTSEMPGVQIGNNGNSGTEIFIRGIGSTNDTEAGDPAVSFSVDGVYIGRPSGASGPFFDIDRIEILRGPQGTLYGRNAVAGAINVITNQPTQKFAGNGEVTFGNYGAINTQGAINVPINNDWAVRLAFLTESHDGYIDNRNPPAVTKDSSDADNAAARLRVLYAPSDNFSLLFSGDYTHAGGVGVGQVPFTTLTHSGDAGRTEPYDTQGSIDDTYGGFSLETNWAIDWVKLTSLSAYRINERNDISDGDVSTNQPTLAGTFFSDFNQFSEEFRAASKSDSPVQWVGGLYYYVEHNDVSLNVTNEVAPGLGVAFIQPDTYEASYAAFGQADYHLTDDLMLSAGLRDSADNKHRYGGTFLVPQGGAPIEILRNAAKVNFNKLTWKAAADWTWSPQNSLYALVGTGFKAGGYFDGAIDNSYAPENLTAYEIGSKNRFFDNRLALNISAYDYDYKDFQVSETTTLPGGQGLGSVTYDAQKATAYGLELEGQYRPTPDDRLSISATYEHSKFDKFIIPAATDAPACPNGFIAPSNGLCDMSGNQFQRAPEFTVSVGYSRNWDLPSGATIVTEGRVYWSDKYYVFFINDARMAQSAFTRTDLSASYNAPDDRYFVQLFVRNLEDNNVAVQGTFVEFPSATLAPPRTFGIRFGARLAGSD